MMFHALLAFTSALLAGSLATLALYSHGRELVHRLFAVGMASIALMEGFYGLSLQAKTPAEVIFWQNFVYVTNAIAPGVWFLFALSFARSNYREIFRRWRYVICGTFLFPLLLVLFFQKRLFSEITLLQSQAWILHLAWPGYLLQLFLLLASVLILANFERTLTSFTGSTRWQIKFMILGSGTLFASQIYTSSQALLFSSTHVNIESINSYATLIASILMIISFVRNYQLNVNIYLSQTALHSSITAFIVGIYLLAVGFLTKFINYFGNNINLPLGTFFVFLALIGLAILLLSDELRYQVKRFINRHFYRPRYDYRKEWTRFTERTATLVQPQELYSAVCQMVADMFGVPSVTIWLWDQERQKTFSLGASTFFSTNEAPLSSLNPQTVICLLDYLRAQQMPVDFTNPTDNAALALSSTDKEVLQAARIRYGIALMTGQQLVGIMTLSDKHTKEPFTIEDDELLKTIAEQTAAHVLNLRLGQRLMQAKQMETFQALSAFFVHDLKNLAAKLSLMVDNLPRHYDNPEFRQDALRLIGASVSQMNTMCSRLSSLTKHLELHCVATDINELVRCTCAELGNALKASLQCELQPVQKILIDPEQIQKVLLNLLLNADEAIEEHGHICIKTHQSRTAIFLSVQDNGCGMSQDFIDQFLFHPFRTTKSKGLGIGLFQSRTIIEAHHGHIEVESTLGHGTIFRIVLPLLNTLSPHLN